MEAGESRLISSAVLSAHDKDTSSSDIIYVFESIPSHGVIQMKVSSLHMQWEKYLISYCQKYQSLWECFSEHEIV